MCGCGKIKIVPQADASKYTYTFPIQEVGTSSRCKFMTVFCLSADKVNAALNPYNIRINSMDGMKDLANDYDSGKLMGLYKVDMWNDVLNKIIFSPEEQAKTECSMACVLPN